MDAIEEAIEKAYLANITSNYNQLNVAILDAKSDQAKIDIAKERFKAGFAHANKIKVMALELINS